MEFNAILPMLQSRVPLLNKIWPAISCLFSAPNDIKYIQDELARMRAYLEKAEADSETARNKRELITQIRELAYDAEDSLDEFKRLLVQPTDQEIFGHLRRCGFLFRDRAGPWFLKIHNWLLGTGAGHLFCGVVTCYFLGIGTCARFLRIVLEQGSSLFVRTAADVYNSLPKAGIELGFPLLIRISLDPLLRTGHLHLADHEIVGLFLRIGDLLWSTGAVFCFIKISTCFLVLKISAFFLRTQLQRLSTRFLESASTGILGIGLVLRTSFEHDTYWLRTGFEFSTRFLRKVHAKYWIKIEAQKLKPSVELKEMRNNVIPVASNPGRLLERYPSRLDAHFIQDSELISIKKSRDKLLDILLDENREKTCVLTVVGCAGLGKTTLVRNVFNSQRLIDGGSSGPFTCRAWITVSPSFQLVGFLKKIFRKLSPDDYNPEWDAEELISKIRCHLQDRRYVIVFDDVWTVDAWNYIKKVFPVNMKGSRVIVTTRYMKIAHDACVHNQEHVYKLPTLSPSQSMELFCKIVFGGDSCPPYLKFPSEKILKKCGGVPLAIKSIGGVLARKPAKTVDDWKGMLDHLGSGLQTEPEIKKMMQIMALSYNALPDHHLKRCFLYLSIFPEDNEIDSMQLKALWIAEGMIGHHTKMTPEEVAESYLNEFVSRSMIQATEISDRGRVKRCRVHDVMLEFIVKETVEQNLVTLYGKHGSPLPQAKIRRLCLQSPDSQGFLLENTRQDHLRSLIMFEPRYPRELRSFICRCRFLRVLELHAAYRWITDSHLDAIGKLYHLKHLSLSCCLFGSIPKSFGGLENLETLVVRSSKTVFVPAEVFQLPRLRHLKGSWHAQPGFRCPHTLQTLDGLITIGKGDIQELRKLTHLTKLGIGLRLPDELMACCDAISEMSRSLRSLKLTFTDDTTVGFLSSPALPPMLLQSLHLKGYLRKLPRWVNSNSLRAVTKIVLTDSELAFDAIGALQELPNLVVLKLRGGSYREEKLHFSGHGFGRLQVLHLHHIYSLESLSFAAGSMPSLQVLRVQDCRRLRGVSNLLNLSCLKQVTVGPQPFQVSETTKAHPNNPTFEWEQWRFYRSSTKEDIIIS